MQDLILPTFTVTDLPTLQDVAETLAAATKEVRTIEALRKEKTRKLDDLKKDYMATEKQNSAPHLAVIAATEKALSDWRLTPEVQEGVAQIRLLERKSRDAAKGGDTTAVELIGQNITDLAAKYPKAMPVEGGSLVFSERLEVRIDDESSIPERFFKQVVDEAAIREFIEVTGSAPEGVEFGYRFNVSFREKKAESGRGGSDIHGSLD